MEVGIFGMFGRARAKANLSPAERAVLKLIEGVLPAGLVSAAPVVAQALAGQHPDLLNALHVGLSAFCVAALGAILKYAQAFGDPPIGGGSNGGAGGPAAPVGQLRRWASCAGGPAAPVELLRRWNCCAGSLASIRPAGSAWRTFDNCVCQREQ